ncbi:zona pellucida sperm-binding protein 4-like [Parambassis ranga]|uniref:Zona pellucida sperm-binding protein 4-like n=1 Tax=Parambassis ranga TaxID=210632 RepID=A0A6P7ISS6_9TELE|nr:zona pellucida sperm-binding protein 4-like [Parambassis ranga]
MKDHSVKLCRIFLFLTFMVQLCCCAPTIHRKTTPAQGMSQLALPKVSCSVRGIKAVFGPRVKNNVHVRDMAGDPIPVPRSEESCGVKVVRKNQSLTFFSRYDGCYTQFEGRKVVIPLQVQLKGEEQWLRVNISCPLIKRRTVKTLSTPAPFPGTCNTERALRVDCGPQSVSSDACCKLGCCYDDQTSSCYHRLNDCSLDGHFVFSVKATDTHPPIDPSSLTIRDQPQCSPAVTTSDTAVFKIGVTDCGAKMARVGDVVTYEVEVEELNGSSITKRSPFSLQVLCEYAASDLQRAADLWPLYAVTNPPPVVALGTIGVQMRIATDASFTSFVPEDQLPLTSPLGEALYVEISIVQPSPDPTVSLRVQDCFAYPVSRHSVWTLLYAGCPNPVDNMRSSIPVDDQGKVTSHSQIRRFDVKTFSFLDPVTGHPSVEEMYFYCWVEICTEDVDCAQSCTITSSEGDRQRRESHQLQLVSVGPIIQNTEQGDKRSKMLQLMIYILPGAGAALLLILLFVACSRCHKTKEPQTCDTQANSK